MTDEPSKEEMRRSMFKSRSELDQEDAETAALFEDMGFEAVKNLIVDLKRVTDHGTNVLGDLDAEKGDGYSDMLLNVAGAAANLHLRRVILERAETEDQEERGGE